jgi:enoyl-CoA hydratase
MGELVSVSTQDNIAVITMDDGKANAISHAMIDALNAAFDDAEQADAVVVTGRPGRFSAGFDLKVMMSGAEGVTGLLTAGAEMFMRVYGFPRPVVMAVSGHAIAGGVLLAACGDTRIGIEGDFKIGLNEVSNGMPVPILAHRLAKDRLDPREFVPSVLQSKFYSPPEAVAAGWLDQVSAPEKLGESALAEAARLGEFSTFAYSATKVSIRQESIDHILSTLEENFASMAGFTA